MIQVGLGTVQLGMPYGNRTHLPLMPLEEANSILDLALQYGIRFFDSACSYGESEKRLGDFGLASRAVEVEISTKIPLVEHSIWSNVKSYRNYLSNAISGSASRLRAPRLGLLQFHQHDVDFLRCEHVSKLMSELIHDGLCTTIGVSVYQPAEAVAALEIPSVSSLQVPVNIIDQRFVSPEMIALYSDRRVRVIARSVFLQGLLIEGAAMVPALRQTALTELKKRAIAVAETLGWSLHRLCLAFVFKYLANRLAVGVLGVDSLDSLRQNLETLADPDLLSPSDGELAAFDEVRNFARIEKLVDPSRWNDAAI